MEDTDMKWRKTSYSANGGGECVEVGQGPDLVLVRDTQDRERGTLAFTYDTWRVFLDKIRH